MNQLHTKDEQHFVDMAAQLAGEFVSRAARYDEEEAFPHENYASLRESGYTIMGIPKELGGLGATMLQRIKAQETLAEGCGATALAINMHFNALGLLVDLWHRFKNPQVEEKLRQIAKGRLICGGSASEPDNAVPVMRPRTTAQRANGGWVVNGRKIFGTQSIALAGLTFKDDWHTMGMRATASRSTEMKDVFVPESAVMLQRAAFTRGGITDLFLRATFTIGAPYIGIAVAARNFVVDFMRERPRYPLKRPMSHLPSVFNKVGEMDMLIEGARAVMWKSAAELEVDEPVNWAYKSAAARMIAIENSARVVDLALRAVGGQSYFKRLPLERYYRDIRAGLFHPPDSDETLELLGRSAFGIALTEEDTTWA